MKHREQVRPEWQGLWRDLTFAVPYKGGNWDEVSEGIKPATQLQNVSMQAGLFGSSMYRAPNVKAFASYHPGSQQYTFTWMPAWTLAWSADFVGISYLPGSPNGWWHMLGIHLPGYNWFYGSMLVTRQWFSNIMRVYLYSSVGWQNMAWTLTTPEWAGHNTYSLTRSNPSLPYTLELHVNGVSKGTRTITGVMSSWPGINMGMIVGGHSDHPTVQPSAMYGRWEAVCAWTRVLDEYELQRWHANPLGMFIGRRRRYPTPPLYVPPPEPDRPCDWFDPRTGAPWAADSAGQDWQSPRAGSSWQDGQDGRDWHDDKAGSGWFDPKRCN